MQLNAFNLQHNSSTPLYLQIYQHIRQAIENKKIAFASKLPSKRSLSDQLNVSKNTVESAYTQLIAEGYIEAKYKVGYFVCFNNQLNLSIKSGISNQITATKPKIALLDLTAGNIDYSNFPYHKWHKCYRQLATHSLTELLQLGQRQGELQLRQQIANYLLACRGVDCQPEQIVISAGLEHAMTQLHFILKQHFPTAKFNYAVEENGYSVVEDLIKKLEQPYLHIPLLRPNYRLDINWLLKSNANLAYITPSHQFPFGQVLTVTERQQLLAWANAKTCRYILEDDYDSELRYKGKPIPALKSLDQHEKVIYFGSFSKLLFPALRISYLVLPKHLSSNCLTQQLLNCPVAKANQLILANFIAQGEFEKHLRKMRNNYRKKNALVCQILTKYKNKVKSFKDHTGFSILLKPIKQNLTAQQLHIKATKAHLKLSIIEIDHNILINFGFGHLAITQLQTTIEQIMQLLD